MDVLLSNITASKLFMTSNRKSSVLGKMSKLGSSIALNVQTPDQIYEVKDKNDNPVDLTQGDVKEEEVKSEEAKDDSVEEDLSDKTLESDHSNSTVNRSTRAFSPRTSGESPDQGSKDIEKEPQEKDVEPKEPASKPSEDDSKTVEESTSVSAASGVSLPRTDVTDNMNLESLDIKGLLNMSEDTKGVNRVAVKDDKELWVYYNDSVNLNDIMVSVIESLNRPGYTYLEFNRLARSENAIVFVIIKDDTERYKKPESELTENKE